MRCRYFVTIGALAVVGFTPIVVRGQTAATKAERTAAKWTPGRTPWGDPDLQGLWNNSTTTPLERPTAFGTKQILTAQEIEERDEQEARNADAPPRQGDTGTYNA